MRQSVPGPMVNGDRPPTSPEAVERVVVATAWDPFLSLKALAAYSSLSERMLRSFLREPDRPLPHYRVGGRVLIRRSDFDRWIDLYRSEPADADEVVSRVLGRLDEPAHHLHDRQA